MKTFLSYVVSIILAILIVLIFFMELFSNTILNKYYVINKLEKNNYYTKINNQVKINFENYIYQSGLEDDILYNIINEEKIKKDTLLILENIYDNLDNKIDINEIKDNLEKKINESLGNSNISEEQKEAIDTFIKHICNEYINTIFAFGNGSQIKNIVTEVNLKMKFMKKIFLIILGIDFILLIVLNIKKIYKFIAFIGIALNVSGLTILTINIYINMKIKFNNIVILNDATTELLGSIINDVIILINKVGIIVIVNGSVLIFLSNLIHNLKLYKIDKKNS